MDATSLVRSPDAGQGIPDTAKLRAISVHAAPQQFGPPVHDRAHFAGVNGLGGGGPNTIRSARRPIRPKGFGTLSHPFR